MLSNWVELVKDILFTEIFFTSMMDSYCKFDTKEEMTKLSYKWMRSKTTYHILELKRLVKGLSSFRSSSQIEEILTLEKTHHYLRKYLKLTLFVSLNELVYFHHWNNLALNLFWWLCSMMKYLKKEGKNFSGPKQRPIRQRTLDITNIIIFKIVKISKISVNWNFTSILKKRIT